MGNLAKHRGIVSGKFGLVFQHLHEAQVFANTDDENRNVLE